MLIGTSKNGFGPWLVGTRDNSVVFEGEDLGELVKKARESGIKVPYCRRKYFDNTPIINGLTEIK